VPTQVEAAPHRRIVKMVVTAYCPCPKCCGENAQGITASGKLIDHNDGHFVAADNSLAFGTRLIIPGYTKGAVEVLDRGGAIKGNRVDVFFPTHQEALNWGRQTLQVTILD
jgi:3D (Asp-Asp-Asp) domain-containing protein